MGQHLGRQTGALPGGGLQTGDAGQHLGRQSVRGLAGGLQTGAVEQHLGRQSVRELADGLQTGAVGQHLGRQTGALPVVGNLWRSARRVPAGGPEVRWHFEWGRANAPA